MRAAATTGTVTPNATAATRVRRSQAERTASMRARVLDATVECLSDLGYARTTTIEVAARAAVSRGALLHHFPTKADLVTAAVEHVFARRHTDFVAAMQRLPKGADRAAASIDLLWEIFQGPPFVAWLELAVASRTDAELRPRYRQVCDRFTATVAATFAELFPPPDGQLTGTHFVAPALAFALLDGLALRRITGDDPALTRAVLDAFKDIARLMIPQEDS
jgi:AcrR family transcriptional regulator